MFVYVSVTLYELRPFDWNCFNTAINIEPQCLPNLFLT